MSTCCGRLKGRLVQEKGELARLARNASRRATKGLIVTDEAKAAIANAKDAIHEVEVAIVDHDAEHADELDVA